MEASESVVETYRLFTGVFRESASSLFSSSRYRSLRYRLRAWVSTTELFEASASMRLESMNIFEPSTKPASTQQFPANGFCIRLGPSILRKSPLLEADRPLHASLTVSS